MKRYALALVLGTALALGAVYGTAYAGRDDHPTPPPTHTPRPTDEPQATPTAHVLPTQAQKPTDAPTDEPQAEPQGNDDPGPPELITICHVAGLASDPANYITLTLPWVAVYGQAGHFYENGTPQAGHEQDYLGECVLPTQEPTDEPTATATDDPTSTSYPTATENPTETDVPASTATPANTEVAPTETLEPTAESTPTVGPTNPPRECRDNPCGWLFHLRGPSGQTAWFASFSKRPDGGWYTPNVQAQQACLGWVAVGFAGPGHRLSQADYNLLIHCMGGVCANNRK